MKPYPELLHQVIALAVHAGAQIMAVYDSAGMLAQKDDDSPLTVADLAAHQAIVEGLARLTPEIPVLSEESSAVPYAERRHWARFWLVDPLDGTKEFLKRNGEFTVNIALVEGHEPVLGVVWLPVRSQGYFAVRGEGAFRQREGHAPEPIHVASLGGRPVRVVGSRSHATPGLDIFLQRLGDHELVVAGSSLKFCQVAEGAADIYPRLGPTSEWDTAAAQCVVEEAGGWVLGVDGQRLRYNTRESLLNPHFIVFGDASRDWLALLP
ncbi:MAG TPA: 3'(2'),5'-bisphosphate nucleotidase CysQ [Candidatus Competibacteraceae bacterium]|nr:3'(2'),5'-bisphosphate nucleotidase CysQ [Candidatus Competibacteraceae bacterium]